MPDLVAERICTTVAPCFTTTVTDAESPAAVPAVPEMVRELSLVVDPSTGLMTATPEGPAVSTVKVFAADVVEFPAASDCDASTVYVPSASGADTGTDHAAPDRVADND